MSRRLQSVELLASLLPKLKEATATYTAHNDEMTIQLAGLKSGEAHDRVVASDAASIKDATDRARKHWDELEAKQALRARRGSVPPKGSR